MKTSDNNKEYEIPLETFDEFRKIIDEDFSESGYLFRGQANADWELKTTLERYNQFGNETPIEEYCRVIQKIKPRIEEYTGKKWDIGPINKFIEDPENLPIFESEKLLNQEFLIYLRHYGFPSPLLDWTASPFIAAFFAFNTISENTKRVSIYAFHEIPNGTKCLSSDSPSIHKLSSYLGGEKRHFQQQSHYTVCMVIEGKNPSQDSMYPRSYFCSHEEILGQKTSKGRTSQDIITKITLPAKEKIKVLTHLNKYNLNAFSLFGSEESLCEALAFTALKSRF